MKSFLLTACLFFSVLPDEEVLTYRRMLYKAENSAAMAKAFYAMTASHTTENEPVKQGYRAMSCFMMCKHVSDPISKLSYFRSGKRILEESIAADPGNIELLFLRFTTQSNVPALLQYDRKLMEDKHAILKYLRENDKTEDPDLNKRMISFMLQSNYCSLSEKQQIQQIY